MGLLAALWVRTWKDHLISVAAIIVYATPLFWVGLMLVLVFSDLARLVSDIRHGECRCVP